MISSNMNGKIVMMYGLTESDRLKNFIRHFIVAVMIALLPARPWSERETERVRDEEREGDKWTSKMTDSEEIPLLCLEKFSWNRCYDYHRHSGGIWLPCESMLNMVKPSFTESHHNVIGLYMHSCIQHIHTTYSTYIHSMIDKPLVWGY